MGDYGFGGDLNGNGSFDPGDYEIWNETMKASSEKGGFQKKRDNYHKPKSVMVVIGALLLWIFHFSVITTLIIAGLVLLAFCPPIGGIMIMGGFELMRKMK